MAKINKTQIKIKNLLLNSEEKTIIKKNIIYFIEYNKLHFIKIFKNKYNEEITALGFELSSSSKIYYQHLCSRYPEYHKKLLNSFKEH